MFDALGQRLDGLSVLDLYAGTGAWAVEALSRGAAHATLVDSDRTAVRLCERNLERLGFAARAEVLEATAMEAVSRLGRAGRRFDVAFADPPYGARDLAAIVGWCAGANILASGARLLIEHDKREEALAVWEGATRASDRRYGDTVVTTYLFA